MHAMIAARAPAIVHNHPRFTSERAQTHQRIHPGRPLHDLYAPLRENQNNAFSARITRIGRKIRCSHPPLTVIMNSSAVRGGDGRSRVCSEGAELAKAPRYLEPGDASHRHCGSCLGVGTARQAAARLAAVCFWFLWLVETERRDHQHPTCLTWLRQSLPSFTLTPR